MSGGLAMAAIPFYRRSLEMLPVELLYEIQFYAASASLPLTCKRLYHIFQSAPPTIKAEYILGRYELFPYRKRCLITQALRYPLCNEDVLEALLRQPDCPPLSESGDRPSLPAHLFRHLSAPGGGIWRERHHPLPFLNYLYNHPRIPQPDPNSHHGYPLTRAVLLEFLPLIHFLLEKGASPAEKNALAVFIAIRKKDLSLVKLLVEPSPAPAGNARTRTKRRRVPDRLKPSPGMLNTAVKCKAMDIVDWLIKEKDVVPTMETVRLTTVK
ncbi:hypothetical protein DENSPDRAFT_259084 [Dentipellis sp. KUC8613]|nr:hypothetical protein DENSPDRAFT_259084 [Dentipellis sp. KUC8613]